MIAVNMPSTLNPSIILLAINMMIALMTNRNKPSVSTVIGKVNITKIGCTIAHNKPKTIAT